MSLADEQESRNYFPHVYLAEAHMHCHAWHVAKDLHQKAQAHLIGAAEGIENAVRYSLEDASRQQSRYQRIRRVHDRLISAGGKSPLSLAPRPKPVIAMPPASQENPRPPVVEPPAVPPPTEAAEATEEQILPPLEIPPGETIPTDPEPVVTTPASARDEPPLEDAGSQQAPEQRVVVRRGISFLRIRPPAGRPYRIGCIASDPDCSSDETPADGNVESFAMAVTETTNEQYSRCVRLERCPPPQPISQATRTGSSRSDHPVTWVSWHDARSFCQWLGGRLPTEAEWEYAARGGRSGMRFPSGDALTRQHAVYGAATCCGSAGGSGTAPVGSLDAYGGLYDMAGNVAEWTGSRYALDQRTASSSNPAESPRPRDLVVAKGGSWVQPPELARASARQALMPGIRSGAVGFRCVLPE